MRAPTYIDGIPVSYSRITGTYVVRQRWTPRKAVKAWLGLGAIMAALFCVVFLIDAVIRGVGGVVNG